MTEFNPEGPRDEDPSVQPEPTVAPEPISGFTFPPAPQYPSFSGYAPAKEPCFQEPHFKDPYFDQPARPRLIPHIGHAILFFFIAILMLVLTDIGATVLYQFFVHGSQSRAGLDKAITAIAGNPVFSILTQGAAYGLLVLVSIPVFESLWMAGFGEALHWQFRQARRYFWRLAAIGVAAGLLIGALGNFLPMPKNPPILHDMMTSTSGAWMLFVFGVTAAPLTEELAFRGFLLPALINIFRWFERLGISNQTVTRYIGIPLSIILTTIPFALLHAQQVSDAWAPLLLIAAVSVILCIVRLVTDSVAAGAVVHSAYNFVLFAGLIFQTSGFQHLHKLTS
ncbi:MAG: CPBP family glutamic-type intramembrane protease [Acidobacteriaceae bacterium]